MQDEFSSNENQTRMAYADREGAAANLKQLQMTGANLGASPEYKALISPVLNGKRSVASVTPIILGFALSVDGVRKSSAITDRHGNFKLWIAPGIRRLVRIFDLLKAIDDLHNVASTTSNVPILQSRAIREAEE